MDLSDQDLSTLRKVIQHFGFCKDVQAKYAAAFQADVKALGARLDAEAERREHMGRRAH